VRSVMVFIVSLALVRFFLRCVGPHELLVRLPSLRRAPFGSLGSFCFTTS